MVPMVVQLLLELLEKRLPPLENLRVGEKEKSEEEIEAILENTMRNSAASLEAERQSLDQFSTGTLLQVLKSYLKHRCRDVFEPTERFCRLCAIYIHVTESHPSDKRHYVSQELAKVKERMSSRKTVLMARLMQQLLRWCKKQIVYEKDRGSSRSGWEIEDDAKTFLAEVFADSLISISERMHMVIVENGVLISEVDATFDSHYSDHSSDEDDDVKFDKWLKSLEQGEFLNATQAMEVARKKAHYMKLREELKLAKENARRAAAELEAREKNLPSPLLPTPEVARRTNQESNSPRYRTPEPPHFNN